jgi:hypothetical protein
MEVEITNGESTAVTVDEIKGEISTSLYYSVSSGYTCTIYVPVWGLAVPCGDSTHPRFHLFPEATTGFCNEGGGEVVYRVRARTYSDSGKGQVDYNLIKTIINGLSDPN